MRVYLLQTYCYSSFSYSGVTTAAAYIFSTRENAESFAKENGLSVVEYPSTDSECEITEEPLDPERA